MKKKLLSLAMALAMVLSLAACGSSGGDNTSGSGSQAPSDGSITIRIGGIGPRTGGNATYGLATEYGAQIAVTDANKDQYVREMLKFHFHNHALEQIKAFREGFFTVVEQREIQMFTADELEILVCGSPKIDVEDMRKNCIISSPYSQQHRVVKMFFSMLKGWSQAKLAKLLWFITGSSQLPVDGFDGLKKAGLTIQIERAVKSNRIPEAHTCFAILDLPEYPAIEIMEEMFSLALDLCNE